MPRHAKPVNPTTPAGQPTLESFLSKASNGDRKAFLEIYDCMAPRILGVINRILGAGAQSERILEDVFADLWSASRSLAGGETSVAAWLMLRARSAALYELSRRPGAGDRGSPRQPLLADGSAGMLSWLPATESIRRLEQRRPLLVKVLSQLPREQLKALELVVFEGCAENEVADRLHEPLAKTRAELRAAARFLRHRRRAVVGSWGVNI
jgi:RNA polymerase sigma-70 factor, ECF subfamily